MTRKKIWHKLLGYPDTNHIIAAWRKMREGFRDFQTEGIIDVEKLETIVFGIPACRVQSGAR